MLFTARAVLSHNCFLLVSMCGNRQDRLAAQGSVVFLQESEHLHIEFRTLRNLPSQRPARPSATHDQNGLRGSQKGQAGIDQQPPADHKRDDDGRGNRSHAAAQA